MKRRLIKKSGRLRSLRSKIASQFRTVAQTKKEAPPVTSKVLTFLENFGRMVLQGLNLVPAVTQVVESSAGQPIPVLDKLSQIGSLVMTAEGMITTVLGPGNGPQKAQAVGPYVAQIVMSSSLVAGKKMSPGQQSAFMAACTALGGNVADILNCFEPDNTSVETQNVTPSPAPTAIVAPVPAVIPVTPSPAPTAIVAPTPAAVSAVEAQIPATPGTAAAIAAGNAVAGLPQD
jgi:hypothetical protein